MTIIDFPQKPAPHVTDEVNVTPVGFDGLIPTYEVMVYRWVHAGVCGPFTDTEVVTGLDGVDGWLARHGFVRTGDFGPTCANGFATAPVEYDEATLRAAWHATETAPSEPGPTDENVAAHPAATGKFEVGQTYQKHSTADYDCIFEFTVVARTAKFVTFKSGGDTYRVKVHVDPRFGDGHEHAWPLGTYSMAPIVTAR